MTQAKRDKQAQAFGDEIRARRQKAGLSQETLALECELHPTYISLLERGIRQPSLDTVFRLAERLGVKPSRLLAAVETRLS